MSDETGGRKLSPRFHGFLTLLLLLVSLLIGLVAIALEVGPRRRSSTR